MTGLFWADPTIGIDWPIRNPVLSDKDSKNPQLKEIPEALLPVFHPA
ncbi:MAG: dTDP-4-dehydrorhamnose 3,5-epimerase family protein [Deltaproteobacteria bacterium]|nr:dTDP-4-dehydrorhamnose 3,5-epimerase family protein [Deltaproteobacteria bacterium]